MKFRCILNIYMNIEMLILRFFGPGNLKKMLQSEIHFCNFIIERQWKISDSIIFCQDIKEFTWHKLLDTILEKLKNLSILL